MNPVAPIPYASGQPELPFRDQRGGIKAMGVVLIVLGAFSGCLGLITPLTQMAPRPAGVPGPLLRDLVAALFMYVLMAGMLITIGAAALRTYRWSRPAVLVVSGTWTLLGITGFLTWLLFMPSMEDAMNAANSATTMPAVSKTVARGMSIAGGFFMIVFMILLPGGLFWFFKREAVAQTLNYFDAAPTWTDRCPTTVLAVSFWLLIAAVSTFSFSLWGVMPAFGTILTGRTAMAGMMGMSAVFVALAIGFYALKRIAWIATVFLIVLGIANAWITFSKIDPFDMYRLSGMPPVQIEMMQRMGTSARMTMMIQPIGYAVAMLGYLMWIRPHFFRRRTTTA